MYETECLNTASVLIQHGIENYILLTYSSLNTASVLIQPPRLHKKRATLLV